MTLDIDNDDPVARGVAAAAMPNSAPTPKAAAPTVRPWVIKAVVAGVACAIIIPAAIIVSRFMSAGDSNANALMLEPRPRSTLGHAPIQQPEPTRPTQTAIEPIAPPPISPSPISYEGGQATAAQLDMLNRQIADIVAALGQVNARLIDLQNRPQQAIPPRNDEAALRAIADLKAELKQLKVPTPVQVQAAPPARPELPISKRWILRSVSDDRRTIYITEGMNGSFEKVSVGETVPGVGKIVRVDDASGQIVAVGQTARITSPSP